MSYFTPISDRMILNRSETPMFDRRTNVPLRSECLVLLTKCDTFKYPRTMAITGCAQLPDCQFVLVDRQKHYLVLNKNGIFKDSASFTNRISPYDVCYVKDNTVAVTVPEDNTVLFVDIVTEKNNQFATFSKYNVWRRL